MIVSKSSKILVVNDDMVIHDLISLIFEEEDYEIKGVYNAENLSEMVVGFTPDLILLDIHLFDADGRDLCNQLKAEVKTAHIPIILLTALNFDNLTLSCNPDDVIEKPFDMMNMVQKVNYFLKGK